MFSIFRRKSIKPKVSDSASGQTFQSGVIPAKLFPMGCYTFAVACGHCKNRNSDKCHDCKCEVRSGFEIDPDSFNECIGG